MRTEISGGGGKRKTLPVPSGMAPVVSDRAIVMFH